MITINMQYFGGNGASSGKKSGAGGGKASGGRAARTAAQNEAMEKELQTELEVHNRGIKKQESIIRTREEMIKHELADAKRAENSIKELERDKKELEMNAKTIGDANESRKYAKAAEGVNTQITTLKRQADASRENAKRYKKIQDDARNQISRLNMIHEEHNKAIRNKYA